MEEAVAASERGEWVDAEALLRRSLDAHSWSFPAFKLAETLEAMGRPVDALAVYGALDGGEYGLVEGAARAQVTAALARSEAQVARIEARWSAVGAPVRIRVDGAVVAETEETHASLRVNPGIRLLRFESRGRDAVERQARVDPGGRLQLDVDWGEALGRATIRTDPETRITVEGETALGLLEVSLPAGDYAVRLRNLRGDRAENITLSSGDTARYEFDAPGKRRRAWLWVLGGVLVVGAAATAGALLLRDGARLPVDDVGT